MGCALDNSTRLLPQRLARDPLMTIPMCAALALAKGYTVFGLQVGQGGLYDLAVETSTATHMRLCWQMVSEQPASGGI